MGRGAELTFAVQRKFDWRDADAFTEEDQQRLAQGIMRFDAIANREARVPYAGYGGKGVTYLHKPLNRYQMEMRDGLPVNEQVTYHYTQKFTEAVVKRCVASFAQW